MAKVPDDYLEARRREILDAASRVFIRRGFAAATMQDIAGEADVSAGSIYRYFPGKDDLIQAVCRNCDGPYPDLDDESILDTDRPWETLHDVGTGMWCEMEDEAVRTRSMLSLEMILAGARDPQAIGLPAGAMFWAHRDTVAALIRKAQELGQVDAEVNAEDLATLLVVTTTGMRALTLVPDEAGHDVWGVWQTLERLLMTLERRGGDGPPTE